ncbi:MAG: CHAT domain-containing protein [Sphingopyxis sp.]|uniref:CHAT domain-containing protein n=1 Tax=Sphingopyxis sp. TaxID=1908224 RepID=UPI001A31E39D|nr:CHAT domain-containing tetratricopeptide repeat protein [Sphingopyxis sp.]MBJ7500087.1 CHAT domain-containing protein [Sphingopyxis sp.]
MLRVVHRLGWLACILMTVHTASLQAQTSPAPPGDPAIQSLIDARKYPEAEALLRDRLKAHETAGSLVSAAAAGDAEWLAFLLAMTKRTEEAELLIRSAVQTRERLGDNKLTGRSLNRLASVLLERRRYDEAEGAARRAIALLSAPGAEDDRLVAAWGNMGRILVARDRLPEAIVAYDQGISAGHAMLGENNMMVAALQSLLADTETRMAAYRERTTEQRRKVDMVAGTTGRDSPETAREQYLLSLYLARQGDIEEAGRSAEEAYEIQARALGRDHADTRASLYQLATMLRRDVEPHSTADDRERDSPLPPKADGALPTDTEEDIRRLIDRGMFVKAEAAVRSRIARRSADAPSPAAATDMELLANILYLTGRADTAETMMRDALGIRERANDRKAHSVALRRLALVLSARSRYAAAETHARRAIDLVTSLDGEKRSLSAAWGTLGEVLAGQRRRPEASAAMQKAIEYGAAALGDEDPFVLEEYNGFALNLEEMDDLAGAETIYRRNLDVILRTKGRGSLESARTLALLSTNLDRQEKDLEAEVRLRQAIHIRERHLGSGNPDTLRSLGNLVGLLTRNGKYDDARVLQARVIRLRSALPERNLEESIADLGRMGKILEKQGKPDEAIGYQRRALTLATDTLDPGHPYVRIASMELAKSSARQNPASAEYVALMRGAVARARAERTRVLSARDVSGATASERAIAAAVSDDGWSDASGARVFALALTLYANHATVVRSEEAKLRSESFRIAQDAASSASTRALTGIVAREALGDTPLARLVRRQQDLASEIRDLNHTLGAAMIGAPDTAQNLKERIGTLGGELGEIETRLRRSYPDYARLAVPQTLSEDEVRRRLRPGEALLLVTEGELYDFTFVVTKEGANWHAVPRLQSFLRGTIEAFRCEVDPQTCSGIWTASPLFERRYAWDLYRFLVQPHESLLKDVKTLYVTTSGALADLPFAAFITAEPEGPDTETALDATPWLGDRFAVVNLPSVESLRIGKRRPVKRNALPFIGYGAPVLAKAGDKRAVTTGLSPRAGEAGPALADPDRLRALRSLPGTEVELNAMARVLDAGTGAIHLGKDATEAAVRTNGRLRDARIVAFATHGILPGEIEGFAEPGLIFTPPGRATPADDGILTAAEAAGLDLSADWVILSACNTGTTEGPGGGDALSALARSFLYAGADALLASRWRVGDKVTAALTVETLVNAKRNPKTGKAAAFQSAMRAIRTGKREDGSEVEGWNSDWAHPAAWAPFILIATAN